MLATPGNTRAVAEGLDHPECVNIGPDGLLYAGGEAGQIYRIDPASGTHTQYADTGGFLLGVTLDGDGNLYGCDVGRKEVVRVAPDGKVTSCARGAGGHDLINPNYGVFDSRGNLYFSDSCDYFEPSGRLYAVRPDGTTEVFHPGPLAFPNGLAIDPGQRHLYVVQSTCSNVVRLPLSGGASEPEVHVKLPDCVPDGLAFAVDGTLLVSCYRPDRIWLVAPDGTPQVLMDDPGGELLNQPTNIVIHDGRVYYANLGGWHVGSFATALAGMPLHFPRLR